MAQVEEKMFEVVIFNNDTAILAIDLESLCARDIEENDGIYSRRTYSRAHCESLGIDMSSADEA